MNPVLQETLRHREAFDFYYGLGHERSYDRVSAQFAVSDVSVGKWARSFDWVTRVRERDATIADELDKATITEIIKQRTKIAGIVGALIDRSVIDIDGRLTPTFIIESVPDFERVVKLFLLLNGEPTDRSEVKDATDAKETVLSRLDRLYSLSEAAGRN